MDNRMIVALVGLVLLICVIAFAKKIVKVILSLVIIAVVGVYFGYFNKQQVFDIASSIKDKGVSVYQAFVDNSDKIKAIGDSLQVMADSGDWIDLSNVGDVKISGNSVTVTVGGKSYVITDKTILDMMEQMKK